jgi:serum/glucocorticoid-regulated kinase 2
MSKVQSVDDYTYNTVIGKGTYAKVCLVTRKTDGELFALKALKKKYIIEKNQ